MERKHQMRTVNCEDNSTIGVVKNGVIHVYSMDADGKQSGSVWAKVRISAPTVKSPKKIYSILHSFEMMPDFNKTLEGIQEVDPSAYLTIKGGSTL
jgi:hypothetical protein